MVDPAALVRRAQQLATLHGTDTLTQLHALWDAAPDTPEMTQAFTIARDSILRANDWLTR